MKLRGFSVGRRHGRLYFSVGGKKKTDDKDKGPVPLRLWYIILTIMVISAGITMFFDGSGTGNAVSVTVIGLAMLAGTAAKIINAPDEDEPEQPHRAAKKPNPQPQATQTAMTTRLKEYTFMLETDSTESQQEYLKKLKIDMAAEGLHGVVSLEDTDGKVCVTLDGTVLGVAQPSDAAWIADHFDGIKGVKNFHIYGGTTGRDDTIIPLSVKVWAEVWSSTSPPVLTDYYRPPMMYDTYEARADDIVYVSKTKKIHLAYKNCGVDLNDCSPMLYEEAIRCGCRDCGNCFRV